jgi:hypothetical protein
MECTEETNPNAMQVVPTGQVQAFQHHQQFTMNTQFRFVEQSRGSPVKKINSDL